MNFFDLSYIKESKITGDLTKNVFDFLSENNRKDTAIHCVSVAYTCADLAKKFNLDIDIAYNAGILHDISGAIKPSDMLEYAENNNWYVDESEKKYNFILHQRMSAVIAKKIYNIKDENILSAIECHSTLKSNPSEYDMLLFLADKISWDRNTTPPFLGILNEELKVSLVNASLAYINYALDNGMVLFPHKWLIEAKEWLENKV